MAFAHKVAFGDADVADDTLAGGVARAEGQLASGLLHHLDHEHDAVWSAPGLGVDVYALEKAERTQPPPRRLDEQAVIGIAFRQAELPANHVVMGPEVADNVDPLDIDVRTLVDDANKRMTAK